MSKILVVDDEAIITMQLEERLSTLGYTVVGMAASGEEAVEKARRLEPDLVLMDIVMPGRMNGIEAAEIIITDLHIPVIFVTSYADDKIIEKAKHVKPSGYIVKPFNELEIKATIEVALYNKSTETNKTRSKRPIKTHSDTSGEMGKEEELRSLSLDLPEVKTILLKDMCTDIILVLYSDQAVKEVIFKYAIEEGVHKGILNLFFYTHSPVTKYFLHEIKNGKLVTCRTKEDDISLLRPFLEQYLDGSNKTDSQTPVQILLDVPAKAEYGEIIAITDYILSFRERTVPVSGIIAVNLTTTDHHLISTLSRLIPHIIVSTGTQTALSFAHHSFPSHSVFIVPQATIDEVVKKSLEPVVLSLLDRPQSGYDIVHEIHNRYRVLVPQARIYTLLYRLCQDGYLEVKTSGKSKLYTPTEEGQVYIRQKLDEFRHIFQHILNGDQERSAETASDT